MTGKSLALFVLVSVINASEIPSHPRPIIPPQPSEPLTIVAGTPDFPTLNPPRSGIFNECAFCESGRAEWHYDLNMLKHMAYECGFDYLLLRFDRIYRFDSLTVSATYYFSATPQTLRFDSSIVRYGPAVAKKTLFFPCVSCNAIKSWQPSKPEDTSFVEKLRLIDKAEDFSKSFSSAMLARSKVGGLRIAFSFGLAGESYVLDERTGVTNTTLPLNVRGIDTGCGSYKLAYFFNPERGIPQADLIAGPWIRNVSLAYTYNM